MMTAAIIAGGGLGKRMKIPGGKQFFRVGGKPMMLYAILPFERSNLINEIILVVPFDKVELCKEEIVKKYSLKKIKIVVGGGERRQDSVFIALNSVSENMELVLIHDGVRPLIGRPLVEKVIEGARQYDGVVPALKIIPTVKETDKNGYVIKTLVRENLVEVQTPQAFRYEILKKAYKYAMEENISITDDSAAVEMVGGRVKIVEGDYRNQKVTFPEDLEWLKVCMGLD